MTIALLLTGAAVVILLLIIILKDGETQADFKQTYNEMKEETELRRRRLLSLHSAYEVARDELGEEPSIEQIILTRDTLEDFDGQA